MLGEVSARPKVCTEKWTACKRLRTARGRHLLPEDHSALTCMTRDGLNDSPPAGTLSASGLAIQGPIKRPIRTQAGEARIAWACAPLALLLGRAINHGSETQGCSSRRCPCRNVPRPLRQHDDSFHGQELGNINHGSTTPLLNLEGARHAPWGPAIITLVTWALGPDTWTRLWSLGQQGAMATTNMLSDAPGLGTPMGKPRRTTSYNCRPYTRHWTSTI